MQPLPIHKRSTIYVIAMLVALSIATPVMADYLGPNRTITETTGVCKIVLNECQYVAAKDEWKYKNVEDWVCSNESKPWQAYSNASRPCNDTLHTSGYQYWSREEDLQTVTVSHPPATIGSSLESCTLQNGWCGVTTPQLSISANEPLAGYGITLIEGTLNGQIFACPNGMANCRVPLNEGDNAFTYWALSSWGDSSTMGTFSARVDTVSPDLGLNVGGANGTNGWYVSPTTVTAVGSDGTSGLASVLLSVNSGDWQPSVTLNEGIHNLSFTAVDNAGNVSTSSTTIAVDTTTPSISVSVSGTAGKNGWYRSDIQVSAIASDKTSGISTFEVSIDNNAYQNYTSDISFSDGHHSIKFKAIDKAGNITETPPQEFLIDTVPPKVDLPASWDLGRNVPYDVQDAGSGLAGLRLVIEDEDERYAKVAWNENVSGPSYAQDINWNGEFRDKTIAPPGVYLIWIKASDRAGNEHIELGKITIPESDLVFDRSPHEEPSTEAFVPPADLFDAEDSTQTEPAPPIIDFGNSTTDTAEITEQPFLLVTGTSGSIPDGPSNILWGSAAAAAIGAATTYVLGEQRKREEALARQAAEAKAEMEEDAKRRERSQQKQQENWEKQQAIQRAPKPTSIDAKVARDEYEESIAWSVSHTAIRKQYPVTSDAKVARQEHDETIAWMTSLIEARQSIQDEKERQLQAAYYAAMRQAAVEAEKNAPKLEPNAWEKTKNFFNEKIIQPAQPAITTMKEIETWVNEKFYYPHVQPAEEKIKKSVTEKWTEFDQNFYQPRVKPLMDKIDKTVTDGITWVDEQVYQPYAKPFIEKKIQEISKDLEKFNKEFYQPYVKPFVKVVDEILYKPYVQPKVDKLRKALTEANAWVNETVYEPFVGPLLSDINKHIYQPIARKAASDLKQYGEWVHGVLDIVGLIPGFGELADGINGLLYLIEGRKLEATLSLISAIPLIGYLGAPGKLALKGYQGVVDTIVGTGLKAFGGDLAQKATKELLEAGIEKELKVTGNNLLDKWVLNALDAVGCIPGAGNTATSITSLIQIGNGRHFDAFMTALSMVPIAGGIATTVKEIADTSMERLIAKEAKEELVKKFTKASGENIADVATKEVVEAGSEKALKETVETTTDKLKKELREDTLIEKVEEENANVVVNEAGKDPARDKPGQGKKNPPRLVEPKFINSLRDKYGDEMVDKFLPFCEKYDIDPYEVLPRSPTEGQTLVGWALGIENASNPVNRPIINMNLTKAELNSILEKSSVRPESKVVVLGYGKGTEKPYYALSEEIGGCHLSLSNEDWAPFNDAQANFWVDINAPFLEKGIDERKIFLFNIEYDVITSPRNTERFSLPELRLIEMEKNNYVKVAVGKYTALVPMESLDKFEKDLPASLFESGE